MHTRLERNRQRQDNEPAPSSGQPLEPSAREALEPKFGHSLGNIRVFSDAQAARMADGHDAAAFTLNEDIFFNEGQYDPHTPRGMGLITHEVTHALQNRQFGPSTDLRPSHSSDRAEGEASRNASSFAGGGAMTVSHAPSAAVARQSRGGHARHSRGHAPHREPVLRPDIAAGRFPSGDAARIVSLDASRLIQMLQGDGWPPYVRRNSAWGGWATINNLQRTILPNFSQLTNGGMTVRLPDMEVDFPGGTFHSHMNIQARMENIRPVAHGRDGVGLTSSTTDHSTTAASRTASEEHARTVGVEHSGLSGSLSHTSARGTEDTDTDEHTTEIAGAAQRTGMFEFDVVFEVMLFQSFEVGTGTSIVNSIGGLFGGDDYGGMLQNSVVPMQRFSVNTVHNMARFPLSVESH
jgi:hypothetical protein